jgi:hypothetical protein
MVVSWVSERKVEGRGLPKSGHQCATETREFGPGPQGDTSMTEDEEWLQAIWATDAAIALIIGGVLLIAVTVLMSGRLI